MKAQKRVFSGATVLLIGSIVLLPNCGLIDWVKEKFGGGAEKVSQNGMTQTVKTQVEDGSQVLATMGGKALITKNMVEEEKQKLIEANPQMEAMLQLMDENQLNRNLVDGMASREIIRKYIQDKKIGESEKYKKDFEMAVNQIRDLLNTRFFMEDFKNEVSDAEVKNFYDENKDSIPNLLISRGGVEAVGVSFANEQDAKAFMDKMKESKNGIETAAKAANLSNKVKDFNLVNAESIGIDPELRDKIIEIKKTPSLHSFKVGNEVWVVAAKRKEDPQYRDLDSVKAEIKQLLEKDKTMKVVEQEVARLKDQYDVKINEDAFVTQGDNARAVQAALQEGMQADTASEDRSKAVVA